MFHSASGNFRLSLIALAIALTNLTATPAALAKSDLDRAYRTIASKSFVDLTHSFSPASPVWSGFGQAKFSPAGDPKTKKPYTIKDDGFRTTFYEMVGQYGTHVDPPSHFSENGITMDKIPLKQMILPRIVLDSTPYLANDPNHAFSLADLRAWEKNHGRMPKRSVVALAPTCTRTSIRNKRALLRHGRSRPSSSMNSAASRRLVMSRSTPTRPTRWSPKLTSRGKATTRSR